MSESHEENSTATEQRSAELKPGSKGKFEAAWRLTDTKLSSPVRISFPPIHAIPIIFVPGIMGSNLCTLRNKPVWLLNSIQNIPVGLAWSWSRKGPGARQAILHPAKTKVYDQGAVPKKGLGRKSSDDYLRRGWGQVSQASYHEFLLWIEEKMNGSRDPTTWDDFSPQSLAPSSVVEQKQKLRPGVVMQMHGLPQIAESGYAVDAVRAEDLLRRSKAIYPVYAFGYNWLASNKEAAESLRTKIDSVIAENNVGMMKCSQVILITHSMGGLVARACCQLAGTQSKVVGVVHGVMPATGAAVAYRRCKVGMKDEDVAAGLVIGSDGQEVTAVFAQSPGALQLLPSEEYGTKWLNLTGPSGNLITSLPVSDPYEEIYLQKDKWWGLIREEWLNPRGGAAISWKKFEANIKHARDFHRKLAKKYHEKTYVFYGGGAKSGSFAKIGWTLKKGIAPTAAAHGPSPVEILSLSPNDVRTDGSNNLFVGGETLAKTTSRGDASVALTTETSWWEIRCAPQDSPGDGTVPAHSGKAPRNGGGAGVLQQFELDKIEHEPAYRNSTARQVTYYAITKLAALADLS